MTNCRRKNEVGFSLTELLVVVGIIAIMGAVGLPMVASYYKNYQINGACRSVASEIAAARMKAIARNVNEGVTFQIIDNNSYRFIVEDENPDLFGPLQDLPSNLQFQAAGATGAGFRYNRLGMICQPGVGACLALPPVTCTAAEASRCGQSPGNYIEFQGTPNNRYLIRIANATTGVTKTIEVAAGGRILVQ